MKVLDLFSGIGGFSLGLERAGMETVAFCETDAKCRQVLRKHWPDVPQYTDVSTLTAEKLENDGITDIGLVCGGFPCQPFSVAGKRKGEADDRHLWPEMLRIVSEVRPAWVIGENVAGIISMAESIRQIGVAGIAIDRGADIDYFEAIRVRQEKMLLRGICQDLEQIGYDVQPFVIPACAVGAPHRRDRVWIVANANTERQQQPQRNIQKSRGRPGDSGEDVADTKAKRLQEREILRPGETKAGCAPKGSGTERVYEWPVEPDVGRVAHGIPGRVDRLKQLGNAVVPQVVEMIGLAIMEADNG